jgi:DNA-binding Lrp family transcriptional regulator
VTFDALLWAMKDAPIANVEEWAVLACLAEHADDDGCNAMPSQATIAKRTKTSPATVKRRIADLESRRIIRRGDQSLAERYTADRRPIVWDLMIPYSWFPNIDRIQEYRAEKSRPPLRQGDRPKLSPAPEKPSRVDRGKPRSDRSTSATALQEPSLSESEGATSAERGVSECGAGGLSELQPSPLTLPGNPPPESAAVAPSRKRKPKTVKADAYRPEVTAIVNRYISWRRSETHVAKLLKESELFHALVTSYVAPALDVGHDDRIISNALAACARAGHEWPSDTMWRRVLGGQPPLGVAPATRKIGDQGFLANPDAAFGMPGATEFGTTAKGA